MARLTHQQQERLIKIFNKLGWLPQDKLIQNMSWDDYCYWLRIYYEGDTA